VTVARQGEASVPIVVPAQRGGGTSPRLGMSVPYRGARSMRLVGAAVLVPVKDFRQAKLRLAGALAPSEREALARTMATRVVAAARPVPVYVVCDDDGVATWAEAAGATVLWRPGLGLNGAVTDGVQSLGEVGVERVIVAHSDLPLAVRLDWVAALPGLTLVPDRRDDGTNVACVPTGVGFTFGYGPGSFRRHAAEGRRLGLPVRVVREPSLGWDVDVPDDLAHPALEEALAWLRTNPVSRA
jgi:2-phospho-L-lactate guanylyltransferase